MRVSSVYLIIATIIVALLFMSQTQIEAMYVMSDLDKKQYLVRNEDDRENAANMLAKIRKNLYYFRDYLYNNRHAYNKTYEKYIETMYNRMTNMVISENTPNSNYTSYTVNKGDEMIFCIRSKKTNQIHRLNLLMFVAIHEMAHVACPEEGHTPLFGQIFMFLLGEAMKIGIYQYEDFKMSPTEYCGMTINDAPNVRMEGFESPKMSYETNLSVNTKIVPYPKKSKVNNMNIFFKNKYTTNYQI